MRKKSLQKGVLSLAKQLIRIDSQNPGGDEREIILFIRDYLKSLGVRSRIYEFRKNRLNLVCRLKSQHSKKTLLFAPHVDTVPAGGGWRFAPFSATVHRGKLYGRGATDCKGNTAVALSLIERLKGEKMKLANLDLMFAFCGDEETGSTYGIIPLMKAVRGIDYGVVLDADEFNIVVAQKGLLHLRVEVFGKEAHGAYPQRGINAIEKSVAILGELKKQPFLYKAHPLLKKPTVSIGKFVGGEKVNIVAGKAFFELDIRYVPSMKKEEIIEKIETIIKKQKVKYRIDVLAHQKPIEIDTNSALVLLLRKVLREHRLPSRIVPSFGATVINFLKEKGIETIAFGVGSKGCAHIKDEYIAVENLYKGGDILQGYVRRLDQLIA